MADVEEIKVEDLTQFMNKLCRVTVRQRKEHDASDASYVISPIAKNFTLFVLQGMLMRTELIEGIGECLIMECPRGTLTELVSVDIKAIHEVDDEIPPKQPSRVPNLLSGDNGSDPSASIIGKNPLA